MAVAIAGPKFYGFDPDKGTPLAGGKLYTYEPGTTTPKTTYKDPGENTANTNPIILNAAGYADVYLVGSYDLKLLNENDEEIWTQDNFTAGDNDLKDDLSKDNGIDFIGSSVKTGEPLTPSGLNGQSDLLGCVIRNADGTAFDFIDNATHTPFGFESISTSSNNITLTYKETYPKRGSIVCGPDETFADMGMTVGATVSSNTMGIRMAMPYRARLTLDTLNIIQGTMFETATASDIGDDGVKFQYGLQTAANNVVAANVVGYGNNRPELIRTIQGTDGENKFLQILTYSRIEGLISIVSTSDIQYSTQTAKFKSGEISAVWSVNGNRVEISHPKRLNRFSFAAVERLGAGAATATMFKADVQPSGDNLTYVYFYDYAGNLITDPTGFEFWISLGYAIDKTGDILIDVGPKRIDPTRVAESLGNVWVFGNQLK